MYLLLDHVVFVYYYASNGNLMEIYTVINIVKILLRIKMPFMNIRLSTNISLEYLPFLLLYPMCVYTYIIMYVHVYTHKIDSTSPVNQHWGTLFLLAENISYIFHKNEIFIYFWFFFFKMNNFCCDNCFVISIDLFFTLTCTMYGIRNISWINVIISLQKVFWFFPQQLTFD